MITLYAARQHSFSCQWRLDSCIIDLILYLQFKPQLHNLIKPKVLTILSCYTSVKARQCILNRIIVCAQFLILNRVKIYFEYQSPLFVNNKFRFFFFFITKEAKFLLILPRLANGYLFAFKAISSKPSLRSPM